MALLYCSRVIGPEQTTLFSYPNIGLSSKEVVPVVAVLHLLKKVREVVGSGNLLGFLLLTLGVLGIVDGLVHEMEGLVVQLMVIVNARDLVVVNGHLLFLVTDIVEEVGGTLQGVAVVELNDPSLAVIIDAHEGVPPEVVLLAIGHRTRPVEQLAGQEDPLALVGLLQALLEEVVGSPRIQRLLLQLLLLLLG